MEYVDLLPGSRINVIPIGGDSEAAYEAVVRSVTERDIRISIPQRDREPLDIDAGDPLTLFTSVKGQVFRFPSRVRLIEDDPEDALVIEPPMEAEQDERRSYYRLLTRIIPRYAAVLGRESAELPMKACVILDISGGGIQMQSLTRPDVGARLHLVFAIDGDPLEVDLYVDVLSVRPPARGGQYHRLHGRFVSVPRAEVERLIRYVTRQQIERRRKGML